jgi:hypothetical protein
MSSGAIVISVLCSVFAEPSFFMTKSRQAQVCKILPTVISESEKNGLDPFLLMGLITVESNWKTTAVSQAGACGLTQVMPKYTGGSASGKKKYSCEQLKKPKTGVTVGAKVLSWWVYRYADGDIPTGLCGYFAGFRCKPPIRAGVRYSNKVLKHREKIKTIYFHKAEVYKDSSNQ